MKNASWLGLAVLCICSIPPHTLAAGEGAVPQRATPTTAGLRDLRKAMNKAEDRFLTLYNKVNRNADQRLSCGDSAPTGTRLTQRSCSTRAQTRASEELARNYLGAMDTVNADQSQRAAAVADASAKAQMGGSLSSAESAALSGAQNPDSNIDTKSGEAAGKISQQALAFEENLQTLFNKHPDLRQLYDEFMATRQRYQEAGGAL